MNPEQLLNRFSTHLKNIVAKAMNLATDKNNPEVSPLHILITIMGEEGSIASEVIKKYQIDQNYIFELIDCLPKISEEEKQTKTITVPGLDKNSKKIIERAMLAAFDRQHKHVGTEHLLFALVNSKEETLNLVFNKFKISPEQIENEIENIFSSTSSFPNIDEISEIVDQIEENLEPPPLPIEKEKNTSSVQNKKNNVLDIFTTNLTDKDKQKNIDPVIGRDKEIERIINILSRRHKNNPVLVGEPGVGKTAIVEGLAKKIIDGDVPSVLKNKKILSLDLTMMIAGTIYRGEFESRLKQVIEEISKSPDYILFIDELHNIIGAGSSQGAMDAANILKPALARGTLRCIGATTIDEYKKHISNDPALERRFQLVNVEEPTADETIKILEGIKKYYENFHNIKINSEAITSAVNLSQRYIHDNFLPDKAIDLIDEACALVRSTQPASPLEDKKYELTKDRENLLVEKEKAITQENFELAIDYKNKIKKLDKQISKLTKEVDSDKKKNKQSIVTGSEITHVLANKLNIPEKIILADEWEEIQVLPKKISQEIIGQEKALSTLSKSLLQAKLALNNKNRPLTSLLFVGPSGVGKTATAKILARELYHDEKALIKLNMSEFSESHSTSKLLGSPAGYIGHKERNRFTDEIKKHPYCVILFDEIDKAHPDVTKLLLQILDEGELTDSSGKKTYFNHAIIVLTTNIGSELFRSAGIGFDQSKNNKDKRDQLIKNKLKDELSPAILDRLSNVIIFEPIDQNMAQQIVTKNINDINKELSQKLSITIKTSAEILNSITQESYNENNGARNIEKYLHNIIDELVIDILSKNKKTKNNYNLTKKENHYQLS